MKIFIGIVIGLVLGYLLADYLALNMAKAHGVIKYGGLFSNGPEAGKI